MTPLRQRDMRLRPATTEEIKAVWEDHWYGLVVCLSTVYTPPEVDGLALVDHDDEIVGLLEDVENKFHSLGLGRSWALMTNDNLRAAGLYLSRGYRLVRVHLDAVDRVREHKPKLPDRGYEGIPMRDLWEFEKLGPLGVPVP